MLKTRSIVGRWLVLVISCKHWTGRAHVHLLCIQRLCALYKDCLSRMCMGWPELITEQGEIRSREKCVFLLGWLLFRAMCLTYDEIKCKATKHNHQLFSSTYINIVAKSKRQTSDEETPTHFSRITIKSCRLYLNYYFVRENGHSGSIADSTLHATQTALGQDRTYDGLSQVAILTGAEGERILYVRYQLYRVPWWLRILWWCTVFYVHSRDT